ncbi:MAG: UDP-N-acetylmuramoyl-tripeptide--D-alanyl-D-alanine ligase [Pseudomonadales bacterium]|uniref:UDP-N-acetylmuramoyl-tripeptide--D-alanyl-D- alanine ligase n=1 Tax=Alcanivorax sp. MD8A TaxID=1177157 RepID=UPI000C9B5C08|nr:UDP-N-acetylmuramoyl-tripeptide--D-alanyl-D-alanine ligase [Alcanivorax sp. MD8A]MCG8438300.1 UDP-N-acetylmuramoyl-tripeptide--D-alanyl-D-alanine ligase [Pseudomonadales bacterium]MED5432653.1 UDP-N-acetylmuramoyl-tripeptide--D-alanyl-D-alanine ligase [Pseudomonadota bacterium]MEE2870324.1 UDP-N-acetylmuramoyl-tripeptide--D-alanyl-D-alanine ligase [Pseudomonadota bacterium]PNE03082.1 UDP-N-acetylmuramoyl-tripeptide--D-alanyl-D-alan ine ligase [Alcanivorax sp. MD8A]
MRLSQVAQWTGGRLQGEDLIVPAVVTDTRNMTPGSLFVALKGDRFDAHDFLMQAQANGASAALVDREQEVFASAVQVADTRQGLGRLASGYADQFTAERLAVTGNAGKTTVKEMAAAMLGSDTLATAGNFNNDIGVPLTLLRLRAEHRYAVIELGANAPGEIAWTSQLTKPKVVLVTNVTGAHLEGFGSMQGIANAKAEIFGGCVPGGRAIINNDDSFAEFFAGEAIKAGLNVIRISTRGAADLYAEQIVLHQDRAEFVLQPLGETVTVPLPGAHQVNNALMACAAVRALGVELAEVLPRLATLKPVPGRMNLHPVAQGMLVDDTYNANPGSVRAAIDWLASQPAPRMLVLGAMGELGPQADTLVAELGAYAREKGLDRLVVMRGAQAAASEFGDQALIADEHQQAVDWSAPVLQDGGTVLVKGSRTAGMEAVVQQLTLGAGPHTQTKGTH